jgi:hypothetical protein
VAGKFPTVTDEMLMGTVPLMDAVTEPICAVPAPMVTVPAPIVTTPMRFVPAGRAVVSVAFIEDELSKTDFPSSVSKITPRPEVRLFGCIFTNGIFAVTEPIWFVPAGRGELMFTGKFSLLT